MSRISQTLSLINNLTTFSVGPGATAEDEDVRIITEQFLPRRQDAVFGDQFILQTASLRQRIRAKLVLHAPSPCDGPPFAKSAIYLSSLSGAISATVYRLPGAETHFFRLHVFTREAHVTVTLPSLFRGVIQVNNDDDGSCRKRRTRYCRAFRNRMRSGLIRLDSYVLDDDDEVSIHTQGSIRLRLMSRSGRDDSENVGSRVNRHVRRIFGTA